MVSNAMNLYFYTKRFPPQRELIESEGTRKAIHSLASGLVACGAEVTVLCEGQNDGSFQMESGYKIQCFTTRKGGLTFTIAPGLKQYICAHLDKTSLVILSGIFHPSVYSVSSLLRKQAVSYVAWPHDPYHPSIFSKNAHLKWPYWYFLERRMLRQAKAIQVLDIRHTEWLRRLRVKTPVIAAPNGFSHNDVHPESSFHWRKNGVPRLFFLGRIDTYNKGLDILLDALAQIVKITNAQLVIQGRDKGDRKKLEDRAAKLLKSGKVSFLEPDYGTFTPLIIANYDVFCLPSRFEGFGLSALEAMLAGRVVLVSEVAGIAPHVQTSGCGVVVKPEVSAIEAGLMELLQRRSEWKEMGLSGRRYALEHLRSDKIASTVLEQYRHLVL